MITTLCPLSRLVFRACLILLLAVSSAKAERLTPLGDFNSEHPSLVPQSRCTVGSRTFVLAEQPYERRGKVLLEGGNFPEGVKVIKRYLGATAESHGAGVLEFGCFSVGGRVAIPAQFGITFLDRAGSSAFMPYPPRFTGPEHAFLFGETLYVIGGQAEVIKISSYGNVRWVLEPLSISLIRAEWLDSATLGFQVRSDSNEPRETEWIEINTTSLTRVKRVLAFPNVPRYFSLGKGLLMLARNEEGGYRAMVGNGSVARSTKVGEIVSISPWSISSMRWGSKVFFVANERQLWVSDGSVDGTRRIFSAPESEDGIELIGLAGGGVLVKNETLRRVDLSGAETVLATDLYPWRANATRDAQGRVLFADDGKFIRTNGTPVGTSVVIDERIQPGARVLALREQTLVSVGEDTLRVDRGTVEHVPFIDTGATSGGRTYPLGVVGRRGLFSHYTGGAFDLYVSDGTVPGTSRVFSASNTSVNSLGTVGNSHLLLDRNLNLISLSGSTMQTEQRNIAAVLGSERIHVEESFELGGAMVFLTEEAIWRTDGTEAGTIQISELPERTLWFEYFNRFDNSVYFSVVSSTEDFSLTSAWWVTDGTIAGTRPAKEGVPIGIPYVGEENDGAGVYVRTDAATTKLIWRSFGTGSDGCGSPQLIRLKGNYFAYGRCDGIVKIAADLSSASEVVDEFMVPWAVPHRGYIYFPRDIGGWREALSRVDSNGTVEDVHLLDGSVVIGGVDDGSRALSVGDKLLVWLTSESAGMEPFVLSGDDDECPSDPKKLVKGVCGCGNADVDLDDNEVIDCEEAGDLCPRDPNKTKPGYCGCGVADNDTNTNGAPDCLERRGDWCGYPRFATWCGVMVTPTPGYAR